MVRSAVITLLKEMNQPQLAKLSPLSQSSISNIANWKYSATLSEEKCRKFGEWFRTYRAEKNRAAEMPFDTTKETRLVFHQELEIPLMRRWFSQNKNPLDGQLYHYATELNKGCVRQERGMVTVEKLKNWWKNERQREKRISTQTLRQLDNDPPSFCYIDNISADKEDHSMKRMRSEVKKSLSPSSDRLLRSQNQQCNTSRPSAAATSGQSGSSVSDSYTTIPGPSQSAKRTGAVGDNVNLVYASGVGQSQSQGQNTGFVSLLHSSADAENGNHPMMLSGGNVVRAVSLLPAGLVKAGGVMPGTSLLPRGSQPGNVVRTRASSQQYNPRMPSQEYGGAQEETKQTGQHWA